MGKIIGNFFNPIMSMLGAGKPQVSVAGPSAAPAASGVDPVNGDALEQSRLASLEELRKKNMQSLRIDLANPAAGSGDSTNGGVFIPQ